MRLNRDLMLFYLQKDSSVPLKFFSLSYIAKYISPSLLIFRILRVGALSRSFFGKFFCYGFGSAIFIYITVNMSMVLGLLPIVGSPLPIMSYGGSSMMATMFGLGVAMSCKIYKDVPVN